MNESNTRPGATANSELEYDFSKPAVSVAQAVHTRHSVREYDQRAVDPEVLRELFSDALRAPSWKNTQPWKLHVLTGAARTHMATQLKSAAQNGPPRPDVAWLENYPSDARKRMFDNGMRVYEVAGIERKDKDARDAFMLRNFEFFGAPVAVFITTTFETNFYVGLDLGCLLESIMLLARERGLATCPQAALGAFPDVVRAELKLADTERVVCGLSLGYAKEDSALNGYHTRREELDTLVKFY